MEVYRNIFAIIFLAYTFTSIVWAFLSWSKLIDREYPGKVFWGNVVLLGILMILSSF